MVARTHLYKYLCAFPSSSAKMKSKNFFIGGSIQNLSNLNCPKQRLSETLNFIVYLDKSTNENRNKDLRKM